MVLKIRKTNSSQWLDLMPYMEPGGLTRTRKDIEGQNSGRVMLNADTIRDVKASKIELDITCRPLTGAELHDLLDIIENEWVIVSYTDPRAGLRDGVTFFSDNTPATCQLIKRDGTERWGGVAFTLIEK